MRTVLAIVLVTVVAAPCPWVQAQTSNSGASGYVGDQEKPGASAHPPGQPTGTTTTGNDVSGATSAQNSGAGIGGAPGNKNGPAARPGTVGAAQDNAVQQQDPANVKGLPGNKSGPPAKR
jgi:hypothetical protein